LSIQTSWSGTRTFIGKDSRNVESGVWYYMAPSLKNRVHMNNLLD
jgi:hypothetical protein